MEIITAKQILATAALRPTPLDAKIWANMKRPENTNIEVCHFMPVQFFKTFLRKGCLSLCRCDKFKDVTDGLLPDPNVKMESRTMTRMFDELFTAPPSSRTSVNPTGWLAKETYEQQQVSRTITYVHCWFTGDSSDPEMWKEYGENGAGVCIESSSFDLLRFLTKPQNVERFSLGAVTYSDGTESIATLVEDAPFFHKPGRYCHEREIRLLAWLAHDPATLEYDNTSERIAIPVQLSAFIHRVILGKQVDHDTEFEIAGLIAEYANGVPTVRQPK